MPLLRTLSIFAAVVTLSCIAASCTAEQMAAPVEERATVRIGLFNIRELETGQLTDVDEDGVGLAPSVLAAGEIVRQVRPDILVINEIDHDYQALARDPSLGLELNARRFADAYLAVGDAPLEYPYAYAAPNNTGILAGVDLDNDGTVATDADRGTRDHGNDCFGFGTYPGQYSMAILSRFPIDAEAARTFQKFLWVDLPGHHIPPDYYSSEALERFRLSSKSHWDVPIRIGSRTLHLLVSHPTPQGFDAEEDKNGRRNFDEIGFWARYLDGEEAIYDDEGGRGGGPAGPFVVIGDLNAHPGRGSTYDGLDSISQLLDHKRVIDSGPWMTADWPEGDREAGPPDFPERSTAGFGGGVRVDYILPSTDLVPKDGGVFWPSPTSDPEGNSMAETASDHRMVWLDVTWGGDSR